MAKRPLKKAIHEEFSSCLPACEGKFVGLPTWLLMCFSIMPCTVTPLPRTFRVPHTARWEYAGYPGALPGLAVSLQRGRVQAETLSVPLAPSYPYYAAWIQGGPHERR